MGAKTFVRNNICLLIIQDLNFVHDFTNNTNVAPKHLVVAEYCHYKYNSNEFIRNMNGN